MKIDYPLDLLPAHRSLAVLDDHKLFSKACSIRVDRSGRDVVELTKHGQGLLVADEILLPGIVVRRAIPTPELLDAERVAIINDPEVLTMHLRRSNTLALLETRGEPRDSEVKRDGWFGPGLAETLAGGEHSGALARSLKSVEQDGGSLLAESRAEMLLGTVHKNIISTGISNCADGSRATAPFAHTQVDKWLPLNLEVAKSASPRHSLCKADRCRATTGPADAYCVSRRPLASARALLHLGSTRELLDLTNKAAPACSSVGGSKPERRI